MSKPKSGLHATNRYFSRPDNADQESIRPYAGRWIARVGGQVVGQGGTPQQALHAAQSVRHKEKPEVVFVSMSQPLRFSPIIERLCDILPPDIPVYLVGGAVRDALLGLQAHDYDFVLPERAMETGRKAAASLGAAYYPLDKERDIARLILLDSEGERKILDFAAIRGPDLDSDLQARDFTINAMAVDLRQPQQLLDPLGGATDLHAKVLRACSPRSLRDDPVRILRAVRQAAAYRLHIDRGTRRLMVEAASLLSQVSPERIRDELFRILAGSQLSASLRALDILGALAIILPELDALHGVEQTPPHYQDVWEHTLAVVDKLQMVLNVLGPHYDPNAGGSLMAGLLSMRLGRYRTSLDEHFATALNADRSLKALLFLGALYHDAGKPATRQVDEQGKTRFLGHEKIGAELVSTRGLALRLSNVEIERLKNLVANHMRPLWLAQAGPQATRRAIYRFYRDTGPAGVEVCLLSLADVWGIYGAALPPEVWRRHLDIVRQLFAAWWETKDKHVSPPAILNGRELMAALGLESGPQVGRLLEAIRAAQAEGYVENRDEAVEFARKLVDK